MLKFCKTIITTNSSRRTPFSLLASIMVSLYLTDDNLCKNYSKELLRNDYIFNFEKNITLYNMQRAHCIIIKKYQKWNILSAIQMFN